MEVCKVQKVFPIWSGLVHPFPLGAGCWVCALCLGRTRLLATTNFTLATTNCRYLLLCTRYTRVFLLPTPNTNICLFHTSAKLQQILFACKFRDNFILSFRFITSAFLQTIIFALVICSFFTSCGLK